MAITTKWLEAQGLTPEQASAVFAERGKEIEADKTTRETVQGQLEAANQKIAEYETTVTDLQGKAGNADAVAVELATLRSQLEADNAARAQEAEHAKLVERFKAANGDKKFLNDLTEKGVCESFLAALADEGNKGKSDAELLTALTQDKGYYASQNPPGNINVPGAVNTPLVKDPKQMTYTELCAFMEQNPGAQI